MSLTEEAAAIPLDGDAATPSARAPEDSVSNWFILGYFIAFIGIYLALMTPASITLAIRVGEIAPDTKAASLGTIVGIGALVALFANPIFGRLSDMTRSPIGRRKPWIIIGMLLGTAASFTIAHTESLLIIGICWALAQGFYNAALAATIAVVPDVVPEHQRGRVSALSGMAMYIALLLGSWIYSITGSGAVIFTGPAFIGLAAALLFVVCYRDRTQLKPVDGNPLKGFLSSFAFNPRKNADFSWAWISRFMVLFGFAVLMTYQVYFLTDILHEPSARIGGIMFNSMLITAIFVILASFSAGWASDKVHKRKMFVFVSCTAYAVGIAILIFASSVAMFYVSIGVAAIGLGTYLAVDQALVVDVLPNREEDAAKDLGIFNIANAVPQAIAPAVAPVFLAIGSTGDSNYAALYTAAAIAAFMGAVFILPVKGVR